MQWSSADVFSRPRQLERQDDFKKIYSGVVASGTDSGYPVAP